MAAYSGFREEDYDEVFIILDKMDKIGAEGVAKELEEMGYAKENVETYLQLFQDVAPDVTGIRFLKEKLGDCLSGETADSMEMIISSVETAKECEFNIKFDPTLVRGQSYYTGTIFEVTMDDFGGSVAGGGRYDKIEEQRGNIRRGVVVGGPAAPENQQERPEHHSPSKKFQ